MISSDTQVTAPAEIPAAAATAAKPPARDGFSFHSILSAMNPLQYLPIVGPVYRALTGDVIPEAVRDGGSMLVSGLLGGPIGLITNIAVTIAEKITGIDPEKIVAAQFHTAPAVPARTSSPPPATAVAPVLALSVPALSVPAVSGPAASGSAVSISAASGPVALSTAQLAEYGVQSDPSGTLKLGDVEGADVLNTVELIRLGKAAAAYAANQPLPSKSG